MPAAPGRAMSRPDSSPKLTGSGPETPAARYSSSAHTRCSALDSAAPRSAAQERSRKVSGARSRVSEQTGPALPGGAARPPRAGGGPRRRHRAGPELPRGRGVLAGQPAGMVAQIGTAFPTGRTPPAA